MIAFVKLIQSWIDGGASAEEITERLQDPSGVGRELLQRMADRRAAGADYLGRGPVVRVRELPPEPEPEPEPEPGKPLVTSLRFRHDED